MENTGQFLYWLPNIYNSVIEVDLSHSVICKCGARERTRVPQPACFHLETSFTSGLLILLGNIFSINYPHCHFKWDLWRERIHKFTSVHKRPWKLFSFIFKLRMFVYEVLLQKDTLPKIFRKVAVIYARRKETSNQFWMTLRKKILDL